MYCLIAFLLSMIQKHLNNNCPFQINLWNSTDYMDQSQQLRRVPNFVPNFLQPPSALQIPNILFQTNENYQVPLHIYETLMTNVDLNPHFEYRFYNGEDRRNFMKSMGGKYLKAYDTLMPNAYKADLFRYSVVYHYGGCYMDAGSIGVKPLAQMLRITDQFVSSDDSAGKGLNSAFFCAVKGSKVLEHTLQYVFQAVLNHDYGNHPLNITGPFKFLQGLQKYLDDPNFTKTKPGNFGKGVRLLWRQYNQPCLIAQIQDDEQVYIISKYPAYTADMKRYTNKEKYWVEWEKKKNVFSEQSTST